MKNTYIKKLERLQNEIRKRGLLNIARNHLMDADELERIISEDTDRCKAKEVQA